MADKATENLIYRYKILRDRATNQTLVESYQKQIDELENPPPKKAAPKKKEVKKKKGVW